MSRTLRAALNESNPNKVAQVLQALAAGAAFAAIPQFAQGAVAADTLVLPEDLRAAAVLQCWARTGGSAGQKAPELQGTVPGAGEAAPGPTGNIIFAAADAVTAAEVLYLPFQGEVVEDFVPVAASVATLAASRAGVLLLEAEVITGIIPGSKTVDYRAVAPAAGEATLTALGTGVTFNVAAVVVGTARIKYVAQPGIGNGVRESLLTLLTALQGAL